MRHIPKPLLHDMLEDEFYSRCALENEGCMGRITLEHAIIHAGRQMSEKWAIIPLCAYHHSVDEFQDGDGLDKELNVWVALNRATDQELRAISKAIDYMRQRKYLNDKYGAYDPLRRGWAMQGTDNPAGPAETGDNLLETTANTSENWVISSGCDGENKEGPMDIAEILHKIRKDFPYLSTGGVDNSYGLYGSTKVPNRILVE